MEAVSPQRIDSDTDNGNESPLAALPTRERLRILSMIVGIEQQCRELRCLLDPVQQEELEA